MPKNSVDKISTSATSPKKRFSFFCCCRTNNEEEVLQPEAAMQSGSSAQEKPAVNPVPDTVRLLGFTDQNDCSLTAFFVVQAIKMGANYKTPILFVSPQAEVLLQSAELVGRDLADLIPDPNFSRNHSQLIGTFFEGFQKTGKNLSSFLGKGIIHGLRNFTVKLPNGELSQLNFRLDHTIGRDAQTNKPCFYVIAHLPTQIELNNAQRQITGMNGVAAEPEEMMNLPGAVR